MLASDDLLVGLLQKKFRKQLAPKAAKNAPQPRALAFGDVDDASHDASLPQANHDYNDDDASTAVAVSLWQRSSICCTQPPSLTGVCIGSGRACTQVDGTAPSSPCQAAVAAAKLEEEVRIKANSQGAHIMSTIQVSRRRGCHFDNTPLIIPIGKSDK